MEILYQDKDIAVCIKPVGMDSEHDVPAALSGQLGGEIFTLHRLDKNVGGVMVYARTKQAAASLSKSTGKESAYLYLPVGPRFPVQYVPRKYHDDSQRILFGSVLRWKSPSAQPWHGNNHYTYSGRC